MKNDLKAIYEEFKDRIVIILSVLLLICLSLLIWIAETDTSIPQIERLTFENDLLKKDIKKIESELLTEKQISENYKQYYLNANQRIYEYEQAFNLIKSKNNEKIKYLPRLSDAQLDRFYATQEREWSLSQQTKSGSNCP